MRSVTSSIAVSALPYLIGQARAGHDLLGAALHRDHRGVGVGLDDPDQFFDLTRRCGRALDGPHFLGDDGEAWPCSPAIAAWIDAFSASR